MKPLRDLSPYTWHEVARVGDDPVLVWHHSRYGDPPKLLNEYSVSTEGGEWRRLDELTAMAVIHHITHGGNDDV